MKYSLETILSAPSTTYPGATIEIICHPQFDDLQLLATDWLIEVTNADGELIEVPTTAQGSAQSSASLIA